MLSSFRIDICPSKTKHQVQKKYGCNGILYRIYRLFDPWTHNIQGKRVFNWDNKTVKKHEDTDYKIKSLPIDAVITYYVAMKMNLVFEFNQII